VSGESRGRRDETARAVHSADRAVRRKPLAARAAAAYIAFIAATNPEREEPTMNALTAPNRTRIAALAAAVLTSTVVLGATVLGMQSASTAAAADLQVAAQQRGAATAPAVN
jgi:hypothetical protein